MKRTANDKQAQERYRLLLARITESTSINPLESAQQQAQRIARAKADYAFFVTTYFPHYATSACAPFHIAIAVSIKKNKHCKYLLGWGRGLAKSVHLTILVPLWLWINEDSKVMLLVGQTQDKANVLLSDVQAEFEANQLLIHDYGPQQTTGQWETGKFITKNDCAFFALGMGQSVRGLRHRQHRVTYAVADDLDTKEICRNPKRLRQGVAWICEDLLGTMDANASRYIQVNNVFAPSTMLTEIRDTRQGFTYNQQNATDANGMATWPRPGINEFYATQRAAMGTLSFEAEYNNSPYTEGIIFTEKMIQWATVPRINQYDSLVAFWDVAYSEAKTADYNAIKLWGAKNGQYFLIKAFVRQCKMEAAIRWINDYNASLPTGIIINWYFESQFWNDALQMVKAAVDADYAHPVQLIKSPKPTGPKYDRILNLLPYYQQGKIFYNITQKNSPDMQTGIAQLFGIEPGYKGHDDSPDADAQAIEKLSKRTRSSNTTYRVPAHNSRKY